MNNKQKKALYESIMKSVAKTVKHALNEGAGAGYTVEISDLKLNNFKVLDTKFIRDGKKPEKVIAFTANIMPCIVEWSAKGYYEGVTHEGIYYDGELMQEYTDDDNTVEGGTVKGYVYLDDINATNPTKRDVLKYLEDYASNINISVMYGGGWSHVDLNSPVFSFQNFDIDGNYDDIHIDEINIKAPNIADNINWYFANAYKFDEIFGVDEDEFDEE